LKGKLFEIHEEICKMQLRLKELREDLGLSVKDMARDTGVSQNTFTCMREVDIRPLSKLK